MSGGPVTSSTPPAVVAVVVHHRDAAATVRCMEGVDAQVPARPAGIVVCNAYPDAEGSWGRVAQFAAERQWRVIDPGRNIGFAGGANLGLTAAAAAGAGGVWLLNPDTEPAPDALAALVAAMRQDVSLAAAGSELGSDPPGGRLRLWLGRASEHFNGPWDFVSGASVLLRLDALAAAGGFDERLFLYWEDVELCLRLRKAGYTVAVVPSSHVRHARGGSLTPGSADLRDYYGVRNALLVVRKHAPWAMPAAAVAVAARMTLAKLVRGEGTRLRAAWRGWWDGLRGIGGPAAAHVGG